MKHFRPVKGWKRELEEVSIGLVLVILVVVGVGAKVTSVQAAGFTFYGNILGIQEYCLGPVPDELKGNVICVANGAIAGDVVIITEGSQPIIYMAPSFSKGISKFPMPGGWILGFGVPGGGAFKAVLFWMYP